MVLREVLEFIIKRENVNKSRVGILSWHDTVGQEIFPRRYIWMKTEGIYVYSIIVYVALVLDVQ